MKTYPNKTIWINKPKRLYVVTTDQATFEVKRDRLDYKKTIQAMRAAGYSNINISYIGYTF